MGHSVPELTLVDLPGLMEEVAITREFVSDLAFWAERDQVWFVGPDFTLLSGVELFFESGRVDALVASGGGTTMGGLFYKPIDVEAAAS